MSAAEREKSLDRRVTYAAKVSACRHTRGTQTSAIVDCVDSLLAHFVLLLTPLPSVHFERRNGVALECKDCKLCGSKGRFFHHSALSRAINGTPMRCAAVDRRHAGEKQTRRFTPGIRLGHAWSDATRKAVPRPSEPPATVPVRFGPIALAPTLTLANVGWDSNVFNQQTDVDSPDDFIAIVRPEVRAWMRLGRGRLSGRSAVDFAYFERYQHERSIDPDVEARLDVPFTRVMPYVAGRWVRAKQRFGFEIDERIRRHEDSQLVGVDVRVGPRTSLDLSGRRNRLKFEGESVSDDPLVSEFYDYTSHGAALAVRRQLTPLTSFTVTADGHRDRFDLDPERDTDSLRFTAGFEFKPFALISGRAYAGWQRVDLTAPGSPPFTGTVASVDLAYTLLGATRFGVQFQHDLSYSAIEGQHAYLLSGVSVSVNHRLGGRWDVGARIGRHRLSYGVFAPLDDAVGGSPPSLTPADREIIEQYGGEIGYRFGPDMRVAVDVGHDHRRSTVTAGREYQRTRAGMSLDYRF